MTRERNGLLRQIIRRYKFVCENLDANTYNLTEKEALEWAVELMVKDIKENPGLIDLNKFEERCLAFSNLRTLYGSQQKTQTFH